MIPGGYYIKARKITESAIMRHPPVVREVWDLVIRRAFHRDTGSLKRGQFKTSVLEIQEDLSWQIGFRKQCYSEKQIRTAMKVITKGGMAVTTKVTHGMIITVCNYSTYQDPSNYEGNYEGQAKGSMKGCNNKEEQNKEELKEKEQAGLLIFEEEGVPFNVHWEFTEKDWIEAQSGCNGWDLKKLIEKFNSWVIKNGEYPRIPGRAFLGWQKSFTTKYKPGA